MQEIVKTCSGSLQEPIESPNLERPLPELWEDNLILWEEWERWTDIQMFYCKRLIEPWLRDELESHFRQRFSLRQQSRTYEPVASSYMPGAYGCLHCGQASVNPLQCKGALFLPRVLGQLVATRCPRCYRDVIYTLWDRTLWIMEEGDYSEGNYMQGSDDGSNPWESWERRKRIGC